MLDIQKRRALILASIVGVVALSIVAEKCRQLVGEEGSSQSGKFTFLNCFDMGSGTVACAAKESVKLYANNFRNFHVEKSRSSAMEAALADAISQGLSAKEAAAQAQKEGAKAAKLATRKAKRIIGPIISSGWDFFEAIYYGGTMTEGFLRGTGTLFGTYGVGYLGEQRLGRFGYLVGSQLGSWVGGRIGLMVYDVVNGVHFLLQFVQPEAEGTEPEPEPEPYEDNTYGYEAPPVEESSGGYFWSESPPVYENPEPENPESENPESYEDL